MVGGEQICIIFLQISLCGNFDTIWLLFGPINQIKPLTDNMRPYHADTITKNKKFNVLRSKNEHKSNIFNVFQDDDNILLLSGPWNTFWVCKFVFKLYGYAEELLELLVFLLV